MGAPTKEQARGYDVLIWLDEAGDIMAKAYTKEGEKFLKTLHPEYATGDIVEVSGMHPEELANEIPEGSKVGFLNSRTKRVYLLQRPRRH